MSCTLYKYGKGIRSLFWPQNIRFTWTIDLGLQIRWLSDFWWYFGWWFLKRVISLGILIEGFWYNQWHWTHRHQKKNLQKEEKNTSLRKERFVMTKNHFVPVWNVLPFWRQIKNVCTFPLFYLVVAMNEARNTNRQIDKACASSSCPKFAYPKRTPRNCSHITLSRRLLSEL